MIPAPKLSLAACALVAAVFGPFGVQAADLVSHQAGYTVHLGEGRKSGVAAVSGQIAMGIKHTCDGWIQQQSGVLNTQLSNGDVREQVVNLSSLEQHNRYRFSIKTGGTAAEEVRGTAEISGSGGTGHVLYSRPKAARFVLPPATLFPIAHTRAMIAAARAGKTRLERYVFEGTAVEGAKLVVAFISPLSARAKAIMADVGGAILHRPGWNFRLAYFDPAAHGGPPEYEVEVDLLDNGVAPRWLLDYGRFSMEMTLAQVQALAQPDCSQTPP